MKGGGLLKLITKSRAAFNNQPRGREAYGPLELHRSVWCYSAALTPGNGKSATERRRFGTGPTLVFLVSVVILALLQLALGFEAQDDDVIRVDLLDLPVLAHVLNLQHAE